MTTTSVVVPALRIGKHVYIRGRARARYRICARTESSVWVRLVGPPDAELERVKPTQLEEIADAH